MQVAAYYFPNYHVDPRNEAVHGRGWTEWELVRAARPRFSGHEQPRVPLWGYEDEADPAVFACKIDAAADHGITSFIFDWYYYDDGPFLTRALEAGYLGAPNNGRLQFALMWANHDWIDIHPARHDVEPALLYPGAITRNTWEQMTDLIVSRYFSHPSYWTLDGRPYFSVYELYRLIDGLGGIEPARSAIESLRAKTRRAGFTDLHLNAVMWGVQVLPRETALARPGEAVSALGVDSVSSYVWVHHVPLRDFPTTSYRTVMREAVVNWSDNAMAFDVPYYPNVTMGWDSSSRTHQGGPYGNFGYPYTPSLAGNTPEAFRDALTEARRFLAGRPPAQQVLSLNAWNEWTEGNYLEPDTVHGMAYLEAIREVFAS